MRNPAPPTFPTLTKKERQALVAATKDVDSESVKQCIALVTRHDPKPKAKAKAKAKGKGKGDNKNDGGTSSTHSGRRDSEGHSELVPRRQSRARGA